MTAKTAPSFMSDILALLKSAKNDSELFNTIVNAPFSYPLEMTSLDLGILVLLLVDKKTQTVNRVALSETEAAKGTLKMTLKPFHKIKIPLDQSENIIAVAIRTEKPQATGDWQYLFVPALTAQAARLNQAGGGIECSCVYPLTARDGGALIFSFFQPQSHIAKVHHDFMQQYAGIVDESLRLAS